MKSSEEQSTDPWFTPGIPADPIFHPRRIDAPPCNGDDVVDLQVRKT